MQKRKAVSAIIQREWLEPAILDWHCHKHIIFWTVPFPLAQFLMFCAKSLAKRKKLSKNLLNI